MMTPAVHTDPDTSVPAHDAVARSYLALIRATAGAMAEICPQIGAAYQERLLRLERRLAFEASPEAIGRSSEELDRELAEWTARTGEYIDQVWNDVLSVLSLVTRSANTMEARNAFYAARLRQFTQDMGSRPVDGDPEQWEETVALDAAGIEHCVDAHARDSETTLAQFRAEVQTLANRLADARGAAVLDPVSGLIARHEMARKLAKEVFAAGSCRVLRFDIAQYEDLAVRLGPRDANELQRQVGAKLAGLVRPGDIVSRWSNGHYVVIFRCERAEAGQRATQIARWMECDYTLSVETVSIEAREEVVPEAVLASCESGSIEGLLRYLDEAFVTK